MRAAIISDTHLGDPDSRLIENGQLSETYGQLRSTIRDFTNNQPLDFLILNGDIMDFSTNSLEKSLVQAKPFFQGISEDGLSKQLVYIPGNHDKLAWNAIEWETNVISKLRQYQSPRKFRRTQPGVIDTAKGTVELWGVTHAKGRSNYGNIFLQGLFKKGSTLPILVSYPNLYIKTKKDVILVTHGHLVDLAWVLLSELLGDYVKEGHLSLAELEEYNAPLTSLICTGVGRTSEMGDLFYRIQKESRQGKSRELKKAMDSLIPKVDRMIPLGLFEFFDNALLQGLKMLATFVANNRVMDPRYNEKYLEDPVIKMRFLKFYSATCEEAAWFNLGSPNKMIYGHTHEIIPASSPFTMAGIDKLNGDDLLIYNTGGWLKYKDKSAEVIFIDDKGRISSKNIA
jgi:predicted phosphodiesterase